MKTKNIVLGAILAVVGLLMLVAPGACIKAVVVLVGLAAIVVASYNLLKVYKNTENAELKKILLIKSIVTLVIGLVSVICPFVLVKTVTAIWKIISIVLGVYLILYSGGSVYSAAKMKKDFAEDSSRLIKEAVTCVVIAILLFIIPIKSFAESFVRIVGLGGLLVGTVMIAVEIVINKRTGGTIVKAEAEDDDDVAEKMDPQTMAETATEEPAAEEASDAGSDDN